MENFLPLSIENAFFNDSSKKQKKLINLDKKCIQIENLLSNLN